jgi:hypothetical protein
MAKKTYLYNGPLSGVTLDSGEEVMLHPGKEIPLPADNPYVQSLVAQGLLTETTTEVPPGPPVPAPKAKKEVASDAS